MFADDEQTDFILLRVAFEKAGLPEYLAHVADGQEAIDYLSGQVPYADRTQYPFPSLLLLDLNMPRLTGFDVLRWMASRSDMQRVPVVVFSASTQAAEKAECLKLGAREFHTKPPDLPHLVKFARELHATWLKSDGPGDKAAGGRSSSRARCDVKPRL